MCYDHARGWQPLEYEPYHERFGHGFERELLDFAQAIRTGAPLRAPARDCVQSEVATLIATEALAAGRELPIPQL